ncbi:MAG TPA: hypothetical protein VNQ97_14870, partial [Burkholderiaceae bacterium]|nr:hypothetical protein [Burkholderiaceae bacterium]
GTCSKAWTGLCLEGTGRWLENGKEPKCRAAERVPRQLENAAATELQPRRRNGGNAQSLIDHRASEKTRSKLR